MKTVRLTVVTRELWDWYLDGLGKWRTNSQKVDFDVDQIEGVKDADPGTDIFIDGKWVECEEEIEAARALVEIARFGHVVPAVAQ